MLGAGFLMIFQASLNYIIDTFQLYAASAVAGVTAVRSIFAGVFPLFAAPRMSEYLDTVSLWTLVVFGLELTAFRDLVVFHNLGIDWASTLIALIAVVLIPIPFM